MAIRHRRQGAAGQGLAEFALVLPILAILILGILQFAVIFIAQVGLTNAARDVARSASAVPVNDSAKATTNAAAFYTRLTTGSLPRNVAAYSSAALVTGPAGTRVCYYSFTDASGAPAIMASVQVQYRHPIFVPLLQTILGGAVEIGAREDMRVGNLPLTSDGGITDVSNPVCN